MHPWLLRLAAIALLLGLPPVVSSEKVLACSCPEDYPLSIQDELEGSRAVFAGKVVRHGEYGEDSRGRWSPKSRSPLSGRDRPTPRSTLRTRPTRPARAGSPKTKNILYISPKDGGRLGIAVERFCSAMPRTTWRCWGEGQSPQPGSSNRIPPALQAYLLRDDSPPLPLWAIGLLVAASVVAVGGGWYWLAHRPSPWDPRP